MRDGLRLFVRHMLLFGVLQLVLLGSLFVVYPIEPDDYLGAFTRKTSIGESTGGPRIVLVGGSNAAFGYNCDILETSLSRNVVNLGLHAGLGLRVILRQALSVVQPDDLVVVSLEYEHFDRRLGEELWPTWLEHDRSLSRWLGADDYGALADNARHYIAGMLRRTGFFLLGRHRGPLAPYRATSFDDRGCIREELLTSPADVGHKRYFGGNYSGLRLSWALDMLVRFQKAVEGLGATVVVVHPPTMESGLKAAIQGILEIDSGLRSSGLAVLSHPQDVSLPSSMFYDTEYHLNAQGQDRRTVWLSSVLKLPPSGGTW